MGTRTPAREYEAFEPTTDWARAGGFDTFRIHLPGFTKDQLKVQLTSTGNLRVTGERPVSGNKWIQFRLERPISSNHDDTNVSAKFENSILLVKFPKIIVQAEPRPEAKPAVQPIKPPEPTPPVEPPKTGQKQDTKEPPKAEKAPVPAKQTQEKPKKSTEDEAKYGPETALQKKKSEDLAQRKATEEDHKWGETANIGKRMEKAGTSDAGDIGKPRAEIYKENVGSYVTNPRKLRNLMNTMVAALLILVLGLYVKHVLRSLGTPKSDPEL